MTYKMLKAKRIDNCHFSVNVICSWKNMLGGIMARLASTKVQKAVHVII